MQPVEQRPDGPGSRVAFRGGAGDNGGVGRRGALELVTPLGSFGPYEDWLARTVRFSGLPEYVVARRPRGRRRDASALIARLEAGARAAARAQHPQILLCFGLIETPDGWTAQLLEAVPGVTLEAVLARAPLPPPLALWLVRELLEALAHAHAVGIAHGDLSPAQVRLTRAGEVLLDPGLAMGLQDGAEEAPTATNDLRYARPEWFSATPERLDLYAAGAILFHLLTGRPARTSPVDPPATHVEGLPGSLEVWLADALEREAPAPSAREAAEALARVFYRDLDADHVRDGQGAAAALAAELLEDADPLANVPLTPRPEPPPPDPGLLARAIADRAAALRPVSVHNARDFGAEPTREEVSEEAETPLVMAAQETTERDAEPRAGALDEPTRSMKAPSAPGAASALPLASLIGVAPEVPPLVEQPQPVRSRATRAPRGPTQQRGLAVLLAVALLLLGLGVLLHPRRSVVEGGTIPLRKSVDAETTAR